MEEVKAVDVKDMAAEEMGKKLLESLIGVVQSIKRPWAVWRAMPETFGKKSVNEADLKTYRVDILAFLEGLEAGA